MITTFGSLPQTMPPGFFKAVHFPTLARLDQTTGDHRRLLSEGGRTRDLPLGIATQPATSYGHEGAIPSGTLFQVTFDPENNNMSGDGFLLDDEWGRKTAYWIQTAAQRGNSVDLAEVKARFVDDMETDEYWVEFYEWALAKTTIVGTPAFAEGRAEVTAAMFDEVMASLMVDPMAPLVCSFTEEPRSFIVGSIPEVEMTADGSLKQPHSAFFVPEAPHPQKIIVAEDGRVYGHLGVWETCHEGIDSQCVIIPRPKDAYASFNQPGVLTEKGIVQTGPIFAIGGHRTLIGKITTEEKAAAYGGIENAWCDGRVVEGEFGPWFSGMVRPGTKPETVYAARASRISGHWKGDKLHAIVSVNVAGYPVEGDDREVVAAFEFGFDENGERELVASFPDCIDAGTPTEAPGRLSASEITALTSSIRASLMEEFGLKPAIPVVPADPQAVRNALLALELEDADDD